MKAQCLATARWLHIRGKVSSLWVHAQTLHWRSGRRAEMPLLAANGIFRTGLIVSRTCDEVEILVVR